MNPTRSRGIILNKIKQALSKKKTNLQEPNFSSPIFSKSVETDLSIVFAENFLKTKGEFIFCESEKEFVKSLELVAGKKGVQNIFAWEEALYPILSKTNIPFVKDDKGFIHADVGITLCESLIARTGSILVSSGSRAGRRLGIFPHIHIVVAFTSQVVDDIENGLTLLRKKYEGNLPSMISLETGPSRTADIEKTLVLGAHGPKELILFLIDDAHH
ncbi:MAG: LUD domain-containing protein [Cytophagaceae bacterium]|nr:LUD domain-containing protein [Cytophagaceae bacterium]